MAVLHEHVAPVAGQCWMGFGFPAQERVGIRAGAVGLIAELDAAEITLGPLLAVLGLAETFAGA